MKKRLRNLKNLVRPLSPGQELGWYWASTIYGVAIALVVAGDGVLDSMGEGVEFVIPILILAAAWLVGVIGLRLYVQDKNPSDFWNILGARRGRNDERRK
ncbi:hypothetical protein [Paucibacter soli]|uniref:hypothetical protein n=1 Tax=Paucibacter soli TaxID=3133433 RepID=UPI00309AA1C0